MKRLILLFLIFVILIFGGGAWFLTSLMPVDSNKTLKRFVVNQGETANQIGMELSREHVIKSALAFRIYSQITQTARNIKPGSYELSSNLWQMQIINKLLAGPVEVWVTIPEGLRREEIGSKFVESFELTGKSADDFYSQFLQITAGKEGYLFPDTYLFPKDSTPASIVRVMENNFEKKYVIAQKM